MGILDDDMTQQSSPLMKTGIALILQINDKYIQLNANLSTSRHS